jgi:hypothetical protein
VMSATLACRPCTSAPGCCVAPEGEALDKYRQRLVKGHLQIHAGVASEAHTKAKST